VHPNICMRFLNYGFGEGGCKRKDKCDKIHPKMCHESIKSKTCKSKDEKCKFGYHVKNTVRDMDEKIDDKKVTKKSLKKKDGNEEIEVDKEKDEKTEKKENKIDEDFPEEMIKQKLISLLEFQEKPPEKEKKESILDLLKKKLVE